MSTNAGSARLTSRCTVRTPALSADEPTSPIAANANPVVPGAGGAWNDTDSGRAGLPITYVYSTPGERPSIAASCHSPVVENGLTDGGPASTVRGAAAADQKRTARPLPSQSNVTEPGPVNV